MESTEECDHISGNCNCKPGFVGMTCDQRKLTRLKFICTIYKTSKSTLSDIKHEAIAESFGSDKARTANFVNVSSDEPLYSLISLRKFGNLRF